MYSDFKHLGIIYFSSKTYEKLTLQFWWLVQCGYTTNYGTLVKKKSL